MAIIFDYSRPGLPVSSRASGYPLPRLVLASVKHAAQKLTAMKRHGQAAEERAVVKGHDFKLALSLSKGAVNYPKPMWPSGPEGSGLSSQIARFSATAIAATLLVAALPAAAQYAGKVPDQSKTNGPNLRAVAVLEWTGEPGKPNASRLVPITLWDGQDLQDASIYMAQPAPVALESDTEYQLKDNGKTIGYYDISSAGQSQGAWIGFGSWKPLTVPKPAAAPQKVEDADDNEGGPPVLHRKNQPDESSGKSSTPAPPPDPDRPTLHQPTKPAEPSKPDAAQQPQNDQAYSEPVASAPDPDRPHLFHGKASSSGAPVLPTLAGLPPDMHQTIAVSDARNHPDHIWTYSWANPDDEAKMKSDLEAIARKALAPPTPEGRAEAGKTKADASRAEASKPKAGTRTTTRRRAKPAPPPPLMPLADEQFRVFQLTYGGPATMVFSAHTQVSAPPAAGAADEARPPLKSANGAADETRPPLKPAGKADETRPPLKTTGKADESRPQLKAGAAGKVSDAGKEVVPSQPAAPEKFITLIAQPDLYGNVMVLFKNVTDASDLDDNPVMHLIDPVDAMADNRGELLFELRGATQREFALYRVVNGRVEKLFSTSPESVVMPSAPPPKS
ncbi:MAG TPA: hypothetical protein VGR47_05735 [Terracidiphilus sp.]|nr:hypothetical protein [Terracidiphilus sp.]